MCTETPLKRLGLFVAIAAVACISFDKIALASESDKQPDKVSEYGRFLCGCLDEDPGGFVHTSGAKTNDVVGDELFDTNCRGIRRSKIRTVYGAAQQACEGDAWSPKKSPDCYLGAAELLNDQLLLDQITKCKTLSASQQEDCYHDAFFLRDVNIKDEQPVQTKPLSAAVSEIIVSDRCKLISIKSKESCPAGTKASGFSEDYKLCRKAESSSSSPAGNAGVR